MEFLVILSTTYTIFTWSVHYYLAIIYFSEMFYNHMAQLCDMDKFSMLFIV